MTKYILINIAMNRFEFDCSFDRIEIYQFKLLSQWKMENKM